MFVLANALPEPAPRAASRRGCSPGSGWWRWWAWCRWRPARASTRAGLLRKCTRARAFYSIYMTLGGVLACCWRRAAPAGALGRDVAWLGPALAARGRRARAHLRAGRVARLRGRRLVAVAGLERRGIVAALALVVLAGALVLGLPAVRERLRTLGTLADESARDRVAMLDAGQRLARAHPLTGVGPGQVKHVYPSVATPEALRRSTSHLHNTPMQILVERGVIGFAAWLWIFVAFFVRAPRCSARLPAAAAGDRALVLGSLAAASRSWWAGSSSTTSATPRCC